MGVVVASIPVIALAQTGPEPGFGKIGELVSTTVGFINSYLVPLVFGLAFFLFLWGMFKYFFLSYASEEGRENGKNLMLWAVVAFVMMISIWGIVNMVAQGLGFAGDNAPDMPTVPMPGGGGGGGGAGGGTWDTGL